MKPISALSAVLVVLSAACAAAPQSPATTPPKETSTSASTSTSTSTSSPTPAAAPVEARRFSRPLDVAASAQIDPAELAAFERAKPVFASCVACHADGTRLTSGEAMNAADMNTYPFGGDGSRVDVANRIAKSVGIGAPRATMPKNREPLSAEEVALVGAWADSVK